MQKILDDLYLFEDTCHVYVIRNGRSAVLIDFGSGAILQHLKAIEVTHVSDVLMTHHHRDQGQGLELATAAGIRIWVPHTEQDLFHSIEAHWQGREIYNNYNMRQDRFSLLKSVPVEGTLQDYETRQFGGYSFTVLPTPGHTTGSISLWLELHGQKIAFVGDLIAAPGKVWSMAATQWSYNGAEGAAASIPSLLDLKERQPDLLLPSHGQVMSNPAEAIDLLVSRFWELLQLRGQNLRLMELREKPYEPITPHLLKHRASMANSYVLLSDSGKALFIDFGYDFITGIALGSDRASRRPWLATIPALKNQFNTQVDVVIPTHFHDDHVAGINLLKRVEGAQVWAADFFTDILETPHRYDLPCIWYDPIPVDKRLPLETPIQWEEYTLTLYPLPGHTRYAVAIYFEVDGKRVLATGDQYQGNAGLELNYVYRNRFEMSDYVKSAELYSRLQPDLILTGHWEPFWVPADYWDKITRMGADLERLHTELLYESPCLGEEGCLAWIYPYQAAAQGNEAVDFQVEIHNPFDHAAEATVEFVVPRGWQVTEKMLTWKIEAGVTEAITFQVTPPADFHARRTPIAVDVTIDGQRFGQQAEALISHRRLR